MLVNQSGFFAGSRYDDKRENWHYVLWKRENCMPTVQNIADKIIEEKAGENIGPDLQIEYKYIKSRDLAMPDEPVVERELMKYTFCFDLESYPSDDYRQINYGAGFIPLDLVQNDLMKPVAQECLKKILYQHLQKRRYNNSLKAGNLSAEDALALKEIKEKKEKAKKDLGEMFIRHRDNAVGIREGPNCFEMMLGDIACQKMYQGKTVYMYSLNGARYDTFFAFECENVHFTRMIKTGRGIINLELSYGTTRFKFRDFMHHLSGSLANLCKSYHIPKELSKSSLDHGAINERNWKSLAHEWVPYLRKDVISLAMIFCIHWKTMKDISGYQIQECYTSSTMGWKSFLKRSEAVIGVAMNQSIVKAQNAAKYGGKVLALKQYYLIEYDFDKEGLLAGQEISNEYLDALTMPAEEFFKANMSLGIKLEQFVALNPRYRLAFIRAHPNIGLCPLDCTAMYPATQASFPMPIGGIVCHSKEELESMSFEKFPECFGLFYVKIHPPRNIFIPITPQRYKGGLLYTCLDHEDWYSNVLLYMAVASGYTLEAPSAGFTYKHQDYIYKEFQEELFSDRNKAKMEGNDPLQNGLKNQSVSVYGYPMMGDFEGKHLFLTLDKLRTLYKDSLMEEPIPLKNGQYYIRIRSHRPANMPAQIGIATLDYSKYIRWRMWLALGALYDPVKAPWGGDTDCDYIHRSQLADLENTDLLGKNLGQFKNDYGDDKVVVGYIGPTTKVKCAITVDLQNGLLDIATTWKGFTFKAKDQDTGNIISTKPRYNKKSTLEENDQSMSVKTMAIWNMFKSYAQNGHLIQNREDIQRWIRTIKGVYIQPPVSDRYYNLSRRRIPPQADDKYGVMFPFGYEGSYNLPWMDGEYKGPEQCSVPLSLPISKPSPKATFILNDEQKEAVKALSNGRHTLLTGPGGTGKTTVLKAALGRREDVLYVAPTHQALCVLQSMGVKGKCLTFESLIGAKMWHNQKDPNKLYCVPKDYRCKCPPIRTEICECRPALWNVWEVKYLRLEVHKVHTIVVDEYSMVPQYMVDVLMRSVDNNNQLLDEEKDECLKSGKKWNPRKSVYRRIQVIWCGDENQLHPVNSSPPKELYIDSKVFLTKIMRTTSTTLQECYDAVRERRDIELECITEPEDDEVVICYRRKNVEAFNEAYRLKNNIDHPLGLKVGCKVYFEAGCDEHLIPSLIYEIVEIGEEIKYSNPLNRPLKWARVAKMDDQIEGWLLTLKATIGVDEPITIFCPKNHSELNFQYIDRCKVIMNEGWLEEFSRQWRNINNKPSLAAAITVHRAQGATINKVAIYYEDVDFARWLAEPEEDMGSFWRWFYTAVSRASERLRYIICCA
jgi:hypothetical protein